jgi:hypothetical protein
VLDIRELNQHDLQLEAVLIDTVESGGSIGFSRLFPRKKHRHIGTLSLRRSNKADERSAPPIWKGKSSAQCNSDWRCGPTASIAPK